MSWTRANVAEYAEKHGLELIQIDGIPEGFAWKEPAITLGYEFYEGRSVIFTPLTDEITYE